MLLIAERRQFPPLRMQDRPSRKARGNLSEVDRASLLLVEKETSCHLTGKKTKASFLKEKNRIPSPPSWGLGSGILGSWGLGALPLNWRTNKQNKTKTLECILKIKQQQSLQIEN